MGSLRSSRIRLSNKRYRLRTPDPVRVRLDDGSFYETTLDAVVIYNDESIEWREIKYAEESNAREQTRNERQLEAQTKAAARERVAYTRWTEHELRANLQKLANWRRVIAWLSAARGRSLAPYQTDLASFLSSRGIVTLREIEENSRRIRWRRVTRKQTLPRLVSIRP